MLKRFMTWLLNQLQKIAGALSGKRSNERTTSSGSHELSQLKPPAANSDSANITVAERVPYTAPTETSTLDSASSPSSPVSKALPSKKPLSEQPLSEKPTESDIRNRLDAASAAVSDVSEAKPSFPTEVSALLSPLPSESDADVESAIAPVHPLESLPDAQLPVIHDLLPAVPSSDLESAHAPDVTERLRDADTDDRSDVSLPENVPAEDRVEQPVLFSFDIVESEDSEAVESKRDVSSDETVEISPEIDADIDSTEQPQQSAFAEAGALDTETLDTETLDTDTDIKSVAKPVISGPAVEGDKEESKPSKIESSIESLPYPWSIATPPGEKKQPSDKTSTDQAEISEVSSSSSVVQEISSAPISSDLTSPAPTEDSPQPVQEENHENLEDEHPIKTGTVKLLFTLKKGNFHGYIAPNDGSKDILFHQKYINADIFSQLERGAQVSATVKYIEGKAYATHVELA